MIFEKIKILLCFFLMCVSTSFGQNISGIVGVSVTDYGAKPANNWSSAVDNYVAFQKAIDENPGRIIYIPKGIYLITKTLQINHNLTLIGENKQSSIIQPINCNGVSINGGGVTLENFFIYGRGNTGITINNIRNTLISNISIQNVLNGIVLNNAWNTNIENTDITINPGQTPKVIKGIILNGQCVNNIISNSRITATDICIEIQNNVNKSEGLIISNVVISQAKTGIRSYGILSLHLMNSIIDLCDEFGLDIYNTAGLLVNNCWINSSGKNYAQALRLSSSWDCHISSNNIKCSEGNDAILLDKGSNNNIITNNTIEIVNSYGSNLYLDSSTSSNLINNNSFKSKIGRKPNIKNQGQFNSIKDNLNIDI